ncbi:sushi, von Willebrand factor type A, EGF and pentraxin domain-containing protein 1-like [Exaiptasia diaphana]|uniref:Uncharacterized protein n=1 Tax=Exaiptasia diaphana TaxID=2652724 RepID=A0A913Y4D4_EXADI|nr:sushi, von Willebrand factor type A, EGF and pentraxin domain-containing protein 1-like [Exaiptasia diaphana]
MNAAKTAFLLFLFGCFAFGLCKKYKVFVMTGYRGTSSRVELRLIGEKGQTASHVVKPNGGAFKTYSKNIFDIDDKDVGKITAVEVHLSSGLWYIRKIFVKLSVGGKNVYKSFNYEKMVSSGWTTLGVKCTKGYTKGSNGQCIDIDECKTTKPCKDSLATCQNTIGSYQCTCPRGYRESYGYCYDINECLYGKICDYNCVNTPGSYRCECRSGYKLDEGKCVDIDECKDGTDSCDRVSTQCVNYKGSFFCKCKPGYKWVANYRCEINFCGAQKTDNITTYSPARCLKENANKEGDVCTRGCVYGYELHNPSQFRTIQCEDGRWKGWFSNVYCEGRRCPALPKVQNSYYIPSDCGTTGERYKGRTCRQYCNNGYRKVQGDDARVCQKDGTWNGSPISCKRIWPDPWINCPFTIFADLPPGKNTTSVGSKWELPRSNYKNFTVVSPVGAGGQYQFPAGETRVEWAVTNPDGKTKKCWYNVRVHDKEPPKIVSCPAPTVYHPVYTKGPYHITYKEPEFSDNVGVVKVYKTYVKKTYNTTGGHSSQYFKAVDKEGNSVSCVFDVAIGGEYYIPISKMVVG